MRETETLVRRLLNKKKSNERRIDREIIRLQNQLGETIGERVKIQDKASGKGKLVISYNNADEFDGILERLNLTD